MSKVYFIDFKSSMEHTILDKLEDLIKVSGIINLIKKNEIIACKLHFGTRGNPNFVHPVYVKKIVEIIEKRGGIPFLTDTTTLYAGERKTAPSYIKLAIWHCFNCAPIIIADGLRGENFITIKFHGKHFNELKIGSAIYYADAIIMISHFKGHIATGFGGAIKNLGMGCASTSGKLEQHSSMKPYINTAKCDDCGRCKKWCPENAITNKKIIESKCIGCGTCIAVCPNKAIDIKWDIETVELQEKMVEYAKGIADIKPIGYINFVNNITPFCDCYSGTDPHITEDIGILASFDPIAIDKASFDLVNKASEGKFAKIWPEVNPEIQLEYGEKIGLGSQKYELIEIKEEK